MSKTHFVAVPVVVKMMVEVAGADNEQEAIEKALATELDLDINSDETTVWIEEWDMYERVVQGNFYHGVINEAYVDAVEEDEDEEEDE